MIDAAYCRLVAAYNAEMNRRIHAAAARIPDAGRRAERGAFFGSLHGTLVHHVWADHAWMTRFAPERQQRLPGVIKDSPHLFPDRDALCEARRLADAGIEEWGGDGDGGLARPPADLDQRQLGQEHTRPCWGTVVHFFSHQTHHRGQAHCLITRHGIRPEDTDLPWVAPQALIDALA